MHVTGAIDGVAVGDEFGVFDTPDRDGEPLGYVGVEQLSQGGPRSADVTIIEGSLRGPGDHYYTRLRLGPTSASTQRTVTGTLKILAGSAVRPLSPDRNDRVRRITHAYAALNCPAARCRRSRSRKRFTDWVRICLPVSLLKEGGTKEPDLT